MSADRGKKRPGRPKRVRSKWPILIVIVAVAATAITMVSSRRAEHPTVRAVASDPLDAMTPRASYDSAQALARAGRSVESVPLYRRAVRGVANDFWELHYNLAAALHSTTVQYGVRAGAQVPVTRTTVERVQLASEAIRELDRALQLAKTPAAVSTILATRATLFEVWGFPWEAFTSLRLAQQADPSRRNIVVKAEALMRVLEHPTQESGARPDSVVVPT